ncbi:MAG TPA: pyridoxamine 5'-phosphate oxidase family protein [Mycoplana sp.]|nr:pyridoxamine 5'-phosphate oxidase family protein [Mycoplana sp.]
MAEIGRKVVRPYMPDQHRDFYCQLPFILVGTVDPMGEAWASLATGKPGFVTSPSPRRLEFMADRDPDDPADAGMDDGAAIGLLGIEFHTRRRNRVNGRLGRTGRHGFSVDVEHSFGNCPKYIRLRNFSGFEPNGVPRPGATRTSRLSPRARKMIASADTFFVASYVDLGDGRRQVDVSHRGGKPGFVRVDDGDRLTIPDFVGNRHFNTLGNLLLNGRAGLLFMDFDTGDLLQMTGDASLIMDGPDVACFQGSERAWTFRPRAIVYRSAAVGMRWTAIQDGESPFSIMTGAWGRGTVAHRTD